jgi:WD40 repeat protein
MAEFQAAAPPALEEDGEEPEPPPARLRGDWTFGHGGDRDIQRWILSRGAFVEGRRPDFIVTGSFRSRDATIWCASTGQRLWQLGGHRTGVFCLAAYDLDGDGPQSIASGDDEGVLRVWSEDLLWTRPAHRWGVTALYTYLSNDRRPVIATAGADGGLKLWCGVTGEPRATIVESAGDRINVLSGFLDAGEQRLVAGQGDGRVVVYDAATGTMMHTLSGMRGSVSYVKCFPSSEAPFSELVLALGDGQARVWDACSGEMVGDLGRKITSLAQFQEHDTGHARIALGLLDGNARVVDCRGAEVLCYTGHVQAHQQILPVSHRATAVYIVGAYDSPTDGRCRILSDSGARLHIWDAATGQRLFTVLDGLQDLYNGVPFLTKVETDGGMLHYRLYWRGGAWDLGEVPPFHSMPSALKR